MREYYVADGQISLSCTVCVGVAMRNVAVLVALGSSGYRSADAPSLKNDMSFFKKDMSFFQRVQE